MFKSKSLKISSVHPSIHLPACLLQVASAVVQGNMTFLWLKRLHGCNNKH